MAAQQTPLQLTNFHLFPDLPTEVRLRVYTFSLPSPRLVPLNYNSPASPVPSPTLSTFHQTPSQTQAQTQERRRSPPNSNNPPTTLASPVPIPSLLHTNREARRLALGHYALSFPLSGSTTPGNIYFSPSRDIIYFPSVPGYLASFKNFTHIHSLVSPAHLRSIQRLAVHEDLFLEEEKKRWRDLPGGRGGFGSGRARGGGGGGGGGAGAGASAGIDGVTVRCLDDFWDVVRRKFGGVEELWILGDGREGSVLYGGEEENDDDDKGKDNEDDEGRGGGSGGNGDGGNLLLPRKRRDSFKAKVERAVSSLEAETGWVAPRWRFLPSSDERSEDLIPGGETREDGDGDDGNLGSNQPVERAELVGQAETTSNNAAVRSELGTRQTINE